jgi:3-oxoacyl-[acyl-carrier protein] reductase
MDGDLADPDVSSRVCAMAHDVFGRLDGALISGSGPAPGSAMSVSDEQWRHDFETVFLGGLRLARQVLSSPTSTSVAWVLSTSAVEPVTGLPTSNGLRPGLAMVIKDLADEVAPLGSRINGLLPGRIGTDRIAELDRHRGHEATARTLASIPMGRYGEPDEFGRVAAFVLSPAASYVTGTLIRVDGGLTRQP